MNYKLFIYQFIYLLILCGCSNQKQVRPITSLKHQAIDLGEAFIGYGGFLAFHQSFIVGLDLAPSVQPFFCIKQDEASQTLFRFGNKGQGPNDFLWPASIQHINNRTIGVFDMMSKTYNEFNIPNEHEELKVNKKTEFKTQLSRVIKTDFNQYIGLSVEENMFLLADSTGILINTFFEYPYKDNDERQFAYRAHAYQGMISANISKNKFVYSSFQGDIVHFYEIENNNIKPIAKIENEYPSYRERDDSYEGVIFDKDTKIGYIATYATDKFVYAIFSGIKIDEIKSANFEGKTLHVFDWNGVLVKEYELDVPCSYLCVSDDDSKIWAIASNPEITLVSFDLENKQNVEIQTQKTPDPEKNQTASDNIKHYIFEITKDGAQEEEIQKLRDSIDSQLRNSRNINMGSNVETTFDTIADNTIKIRMHFK